jgi:hypothetical protein
MARPIDQETIAIKKIVYFIHRSQERETIYLGQPYRKSLGSVTREREKDE